MIEALVCFAIVLLLHAIVTRLPPVRQTVPKLVVVGGVVGPGLAGWLVTTYGWSITTWAGLLLFALLCELYVFCFTLTMNSVSVRLLILLRNGPSRIDTLARHADRESLVERRIETLVANDFLAPGPRGPRLTPKGRQTLATFERLRAFFRPFA
jgi:MFS family permease